jgi:hypothetical protein
MKVSTLRLHRRAVLPVPFVDNPAPPLGWVGSGAPIRPAEEPQQVELLVAPWRSVQVRGGALTADAPDVRGTTSFKAWLEAQA